MDELGLLPLIEIGRPAKREHKFTSESVSEGIADPAKTLHRRVRWRRLENAYDPRQLLQHWFGTVPQFFPDEIDIPIKGLRRMDLTGRLGQPRH